MMVSFGIPWQSIQMFSYSRALDRVKFLYVIQNTVFIPVCDIVSANCEINGDKESVKIVFWESDNWIKNLDSIMLIAFLCCCLSRGHHYYPLCLHIDSPTKSHMVNFHLQLCFRENYTLRNKCAI